MYMRCVLLVLIAHYYHVTLIIGSTKPTISGIYGGYLDRLKRFT